MKTNKKLQLNKEKITQLNQEGMFGIMGGNDNRCSGPGYVEGGLVACTYTDSCPFTEGESHCVCQMTNTCNDKTHERTVCVTTIYLS